MNIKYDGGTYTAPASSVMGTVLAQRAVPDKNQCSLVTSVFADTSIGLTPQLVNAVGKSSPSLAHTPSTQVAIKYLYVA